MFLSGIYAAVSPKWAEKFGDILIRMFTSEPCVMEPKVWVSVFSILSIFFFIKIYE